MRVELDKPWLAFSVDVDRFRSHQGASRQGRGRRYVDAEALGYQRRIRNAAQAAVEALPLARAMHDTAGSRLLVRAWFCYPWDLKNVDGAYATARDKRPDCDNLWKLVGDALEGVVYADDAQVWSTHVHRVWRNDIDRCRLEIEVHDRWDLGVC